MKNIVFMPHTPFSFLMAAVIAETEYKNENKILYVGHEAVSVDKLIETGLFNCVKRFHITYKSISDVERQVDSFIEEMKTIDELFMCVFSDRFGVLMAHRLHDKAIINIFPEGSAQIALDQKIMLVFEEIYGQYEYIREFYKKYPIDLRMFDRTWIFGEGIKQGKLTSEKRYIKLENEIISTDFLNKLNYVYGCDENRFNGYDIFYLDGGNVENQRLDNIANAYWLSYVRAFLRDRNVLIKGHPSTRVEYLNAIFDGVNFSYYSKTDIPWELIVLNINRDRKKDMVLICQLPNTAISSSIYMKGDYKLICLSLAKLLKKHSSFFLRRVIEMNKKEFEEACKRKKNITWIEPANKNELMNALEVISDKKIDYPYLMEEKYNPVFLQVGNLITYSKIVLLPSGKQFDSIIDFFDTRIKVSFFLDGEFFFNSFLWKVSQEKIVSDIRNIEVFVSDSEGKEYLLYRNDEITVIERDGYIEIPCSYSGSGMVLSIYSTIQTRESYVKYARKYELAVNTLDFYRLWLKVIDCGKVAEFITNNRISHLSIIGEGEIEKIIREELIENGVEVTGCLNYETVNLILDEDQHRALVSSEEYKGYKIMSLKNFLKELLEN